MDKYNAKTSFQKWFSAIKFEELSEKAKNWIFQFDSYSKKLDFTTTIKILLHAVYEELPSYREIDRAFMDRRLCEEIGIDSLCYSSLSRKTAEISQDVLIEIFTQLARKVSEQRPSSKTTSLQLVDSTTIPLNRTRFPWATFRKTKAGIKLHLNLCYLDKDNQYPESFTITNAEEHDRNHFECLVDKTEATYVVDRGYFDYQLLDRLHYDGYFFVTRTKSNTTITVLEQIELTKRKTTDGEIISDQHVILGGGNNHVTEQFRLVTILTKGQSRLRIVTNRFDVSPTEVADMYQARWQIELFFKHLKQNLTIKQFYSRSEQGAINQVILTLIATLLTYLVKIELNSSATLFQLKRSFHYLCFEPAEIWLERHKPG
ncbi:transposase [Enterococcus florum]|uniref:Transposase n=1 Tax=Enterococcus florum TaxID=2480627 RepID=A0A4P5PB95_9ENTE|nr:IS4 family transposase [Enterococcus florum]GCF93734.1 transposase [Enterococcus florum]